jgi:Na+/proline symporter
MNALVAISIATIVVVVNPLGVSWADIFGRIFGGSTILLIFLSFVVIFALMFSAARHETTKEGAPKTGWITIIIAIILAAVAISISGVIPVLTPPGLDVSGISEDYMPYIILGVFIALIIGIVFLFTKGD